MTVSTFSAAVHITPTIIKTFYTHRRRRAKKLKDGDEKEEATDDILFDEAFHIIKSFILLGTNNTVESLQAFTNTHVPAPPWAAVAPVRIPLRSCNQAADLLIQWFGPEGLKLVVGGEKWWQVRGLDGIDAEWITEKSHLRPESVHLDDAREYSETEKLVATMEQLETTMLYIHGGGYFWGSINTHRYQIIRYARKIEGRAFTVNYRKAPQYPWPCPLHDVLAAYLYLIQPPPDAPHKPIPPSKIVFAGDSAGGALCLTMLTVLRDLGQPLPSGAVLISPWVDLTHSFPSIHTNSATDIIPPHGFLNKPSVLWPMEPTMEGGRAAPAGLNPLRKLGQADTLWPDESITAKSARILPTDTEKHDNSAFTSSKETPRGVAPGACVKSQEEVLSLECGRDAITDYHHGRRQDQDRHSNGTMFVDGTQLSGRGPDSVPMTPDLDDINFCESRPPKVLTRHHGDPPLELRSQIHHYATTEQLSHPLVSPILQGSLGNLCPLYILAGDGEVLRDEIIYLAHKAANPAEYPARKGVIRDSWRQKENAQKFTTPTRVHLQVYDGMCHVLTVFTFTDSAKYAYRSIAEFVKHVTQHSAEHLDRNLFPELRQSSTKLKSNIDNEQASVIGDEAIEKSKRSQLSPAAPGHASEPAEKPDTLIYLENKEQTIQRVERGEIKKIPAHGSEVPSHVINDSSGDIPNILMIRERVDIHGRVRPMELKEDIAALRLSPSEIGILKEENISKWLEGQEEWDRRFKHRAIKIIKQRKSYEVKAHSMIKSAREQGLLLVGESDGLADRPTTRRLSSATVCPSPKKFIQEDRRWGPLDLVGERPSPTAIAGRRDTPEALALLKKSIYHTAPVTHATIPRVKTVDVVCAAFQGDDPFRPPEQSVSEQQVYAGLRYMHGLRMWQSIVSYFMRKSSAKAMDRTRNAGDALMKAGDKAASTVKSDTVSGGEKSRV